MHLVRRLLKRGVYGYDRNSLHPFERSMMDAILNLRIANLLFMSLQAQIKALIEFHSVRRSGIPDWLNRRIDGSAIIVEQARFVGAEYGPPPLNPNPCFKFELELQNGMSGSVVLVVDQAIRHFTLMLPSMSESYSGSVVRVVPHNIADESSVWASKATELGRIGPTVVDAISNNEFLENVIVCPGVAYTSNRLFDIDLCESYRQVLRFADGIRVNGLTIMGSVEKKNRIFEEAGSKYLAIGEDHDASYAYKVEGEATTDQLLRFKHQSAKATVLNNTLLELLEEAMN
ncbi:hypothetical protein NHH03_20340 [Stieleria sp. TO1_6]|nr:hypothetical protein [Stieleria tagensis]